MKHSKCLVLSLEGCLVNYTQSTVSSQKEPQPKKRDEKSDMQHLFVPVTAKPSTDANLQNKYFEIYTRPHAEQFVKVVSTRYEVYLMHYQSEHVVKRIMKAIDAESRITNFVHIDRDFKLTAAAIGKQVLKRSLQESSTVVVTPLMHKDDLEQNAYITSVFEMNPKDQELNNLMLMLEYLAIEDDVRPVKLKFHEYPVKVLNEYQDGVIETDDDILNMFMKRQKVTSNQDRENEFQERKQEKKATIVKEMDYYAQFSEKRNLNMKRNTTIIAGQVEADKPLKDAKLLANEP